MTKSTGRPISNGNGHAAAAIKWPDVRDKVMATRRELAAAMIERDEEVDLALIAILTGQHCCFVGPPGTGKSLMVDSLAEWMHGQRFSILMTKFTAPEEVFGPISIEGLTHDQFRRVTTGKLPQAVLAVFHEVFKASSAILNTTLTIMNERTYDNGDGQGPQLVPLRSLFGTSNEWPSPENGHRELAALFDRFLLRKSVRYVAGAVGRERLLWGDDLKPQLSTSVTSEELDAASADVASIGWSQEARDALATIIRELKADGVQPGDRRLRQSTMVGRAAAYVAGADQVEPDHLEPLAHVLWDDPEEQPVKVAQVVAKVANPLSMQVNGLLLEAEDVLAAADIKKLDQAAAATAKFSEIIRKLDALVAKAGGAGASPKAENAATYLRAEVRRIKLSTIDSL